MSEEQAFVQISFVDAKKTFRMGEYLGTLADREREREREKEKEREREREKVKNNLMSE